MRDRLQLAAGAADPATHVRWSRSEQGVGEREETILKTSIGYVVGLARCRSGSLGLLRSAGLAAHGGLTATPGLLGVPSVVELQQPVQHLDPYFGSDGEPGALPGLVEAVPQIRSAQPYASATASSIST